MLAIPKVPTDASLDTHHVVHQAVADTEISPYQCNILIGNYRHSRVRGNKVARHTSLPNRRVLR